MNRLFYLAFTALFTLVIAVPSRAQQPFFLSKQGAEVEHVTRDAKGKVQVYTKSVVTEIDTADAENFTVTLTSEAFDKNRRSLMPPVAMTIGVAGGTVEMTPMTGMEGVTFEGTLPSYPANLSVGQEFEYSYSMNIMGINSTSTGKDTVVAHESLVTEGGTFDCFKIESDVTAKALLNTVSMRVVTWLAAGIGAVRTETYDEKGRLQTIQELVSVKQ